MNTIHYNDFLSTTLYDGYIIVEILYVQALF